MAIQPKVYLLPKRSGAAFGGHPWVFRGRIARIEGEARDGDAVSVLDDRGRFIARGLFHSASEIQVRLYSWDEKDVLDNAFFSRAIGRAIDLRRRLANFLEGRGACRLVFSEADGVSGLTVDRYGEFLVLQIGSRALFDRREMLGQILRELLHPRGVLLRVGKEAAKKEKLEAGETVLWGEVPEEAIWIEEGGARFEVQLRSGQKTGFYLDQRENRQAVASLSAGRSVLDLFCYTGGFGLHCARAGASEVLGVDSSADAIEQALRNAMANELSNLHFVKSDVLDFLQAPLGKKYDLVILDPPRLAASQDSKDRALRMYYRLNLEAFGALKPDGILVSCSCSGRVEADEWLGVLQAVGRRTKRHIQVIEQRGAARDHPWSLHCPESRYLKCVIARVP